MENGNLWFIASKSEVHVTTWTLTGILSWRRLWEPPVCSSWSEALVTNWVITSVWSIGWSYWTEPFTCGIWFYLQIVWQLNWFLGHPAGIWELLTGLRKASHRHTITVEWVQELFNSLSFLMIDKRTFSFSSLNIILVVPCMAVPCIPTLLIA